MTNDLKECLDFLGLFDNSYFQSSLKDVIDEVYIAEKIAARKSAKIAKNWAEADFIRKELLDKGVILEDLPDGEVKWSFQ